MPTITFQHKDLNNLVGKEISIEELAKLLEYGKGELDNYDKETDEISVSFGDTNLPYLWSVEGVARLIKGLTDDLQKQYTQAIYNGFNKGTGWREIEKELNAINKNM